VSPKTGWALKLNRMIIKAILIIRIAFKNEINKILFLPIDKLFKPMMSFDK